MIAAIVIPSVLAFLIIVFFVATFIPYRIGFYADQRKKDVLHERIPGEQYEPFNDPLLAAVAWAEKEPYTLHEITSKDGLKLRAKFYEYSEDGPILLEFHGYKGVGIRDMAGGLPYDKEVGVNVFIVDQRASGMSEGRSVTFGIKESDDVVAWANYLTKLRPGRPIILYGISMGAATILMASALELPPEVKGIIADCPFDAPENIIMEVGRSIHLPMKLLNPFLRMGARVYAHVKLRSRTAVGEVAKSKLPIMLIHGTDDRFVPFFMSEHIQAARADIRLEPFEGAPHAFCFFVDTPHYVDLVRSFIAEHTNWENPR